jgi:glycosyltransferase involved in cell wall biosynthesis
MTRHLPLVTVVVPVHNGERHLADTLESALAQTYGRLEVIVVDDGSTDGSASVAQRFDQVRLLTQTNQGVAAARNAGVIRGRGSFIAFMDQDDLWMPDKISAQILALLGDPAAGYALTLHRRFVTPGQVRPAWVQPEWLERDLSGSEPSALLVRRSVFERVGPFNTGFSQASDVDWFFRASELQIKAALVPRALVLRRIHDANNSRLVSKTTADIRRIAIESIRRRRAKDA